MDDEGRFRHVKHFRLRRQNSVLSERTAPVPRARAELYRSRGFDERRVGALHDHVRRVVQSATHAANVARRLLVFGGVLLPPATDEK